MAMMIIETKPGELKFERQICTRCGGSGEYSYNQIDGKRCFGCNGTGKQLTKRGKAALDYFHNMNMVRADQLTVGMRVSIRGYGKFNLIAVGYGCSGSSYLKDGKWMPNFGLKGKTMGYSCFPETMIKVIPSPEAEREQLAKAIEYQNTLTMAGKPRKR